MHVYNLVNNIRDISTWQKRLQCTVQMVTVQNEKPFQSKAYRTPTHPIPMMHCCRKGVPSPSKGGGALSYCIMVPSVSWDRDLLYTGEETMKTLPSPQP